MKRGKKSYLINLNSLRFALLINCIILITYLLFGYIKYEVSDDFLMQLLVSGGYTGSPTSGIVFMNILVGYLLSFLYAQLPAINWFFWMHIIVIFMSCTYISYILLELKNTFFTKTLIFIFLCFFTPDLYLLIQFTKTATIALLASCITFIYYLYKGEKRHFIIATLFCLMGLLIRRQCIKIILPFFVLMIITYILMNLKSINKELIFKIFLIGVIIICNMFILNFANTIYKNNHLDYGQYTEYNSLRSRVLDYPYYEYTDNIEKWESIGLSENDYLNLVHWNFIDTEFYNKEKLQNVYEVLSNLRDENTMGVKEIVKQLINQKYYRYISVLGCGLIFLLGVIKSERYLLFSSVAIFGTVIVLFLYSYIGRLVYRVEYSTFLSLGIFLVFLFFILRSKNTVNKIQLISLWCLLILFRIPLYIGDGNDSFRNLFYSKINVISKYRSVFDENNSHKELIKEFTDHPNNLYFLGFQTMIQTYYLNYSPFENDFNFQNTIFISGIETNHPEWKKALSSWNISNPAKGLLNDNVYLVENIDQENIYSFLKEHYSQNIEMTLYKELDNFKIWKFSVLRGDK